MDDFEEQLLFPVEEPRNNVFKGRVMLVVLVAEVLQCRFVPLAVEKLLISLYYNLRGQCHRFFVLL